MYTFATFQHYVKSMQEVCLIAILYNCNVTHMPSFKQKYYLISPRNYEEKSTIFLYS